MNCLNHRAKRKQSKDPNKGLPNTLVIKTPSIQLGTKKQRMLDTMIKMKNYSVNGQYLDQGKNETKRNLNGTGWLSSIRPRATSEKSNQTSHQTLEGRPASMATCSSPEEEWAA